MREIQGGYIFAGQYQQSPAPLEGGMVKCRWFRSYAPHELPKFDYVFQSWDTANKSAEINDYSVCTTWGVAEKQHLYLLDVLRARFEYPELKRTIVRHAQIHAAKSVVIEDNASGTQLLQDLKHDGLSMVTSHKVAGDKVLRMLAVTSTIENGFVHIPEKAEWLEPYLYELTIFPNGRFDDQVDSTSQALAWMRDGYWNHRLGVVEYLKQEFAKRSHIPEVNSEARLIEQTVAIMKERRQRLMAANLVAKPTINAETLACPKCGSACVTKLPGGQGRRCGLCANNGEQSVTHEREDRAGFAHSIKRT
jgi:predicted phage terminase large subunit-like protein